MATSNSTGARIPRRAVLAGLVATAATPIRVYATQHANHGDASERADIPGFHRYRLRAEGENRPVYVQGQGRPVIVLHELPGMSWPTILFAQRLADRGFRVHMPLLFGGVGQRNGLFGSLQSCFGPQFDCSDPDGTSQIIQWVRALARDVAAKEPGSIAAIGMCLTGAFPLALMDIPEVVAAVLSQPALPLRSRTDAQRRGLGLSAAEIARARDRSDGRFLALRFSRDKLCPPERFETLQAVPGDAIAKQSHCLGATGRISRGSTRCVDWLV